MYDIIIVGAGIFGMTTALELRNNGLDVLLIEQGTIPNPLAASTDVSKVVRMEYGNDVEYMKLGEQAIEGWHVWNDQMNDNLYHETGLLSLSKNAMKEGEYPFESFHLLNKRNHSPIRLTAQSIQEKFPAWSNQNYIDGFFHKKAGYVESGRVVKWLSTKCLQHGVKILQHAKVQTISVTRHKCIGVTLVDGTMLRSGQTIIAAGAWTPHLLPGMNHLFEITGHPVFHLKTKNLTYFQSNVFPTFMADVAQTGWYGFPVHPKEGVIKISRHARGEPLHPSNDPRVVHEAERIILKEFIDHSLPLLSDAEIVYTRKCLYADTLDHHFLIDHHPRIQNLVIASGGSGHGFKFAPILGKIVTNALFKIETPIGKKFAWRSMKKSFEEASRCEKD